MKAPYPGPGIGVLDDVHLKIVLKLRLAGHPDIVIVVPVLIPGIPLLHVSFADSLYGSVQVRHEGKLRLTLIGLGTKYTQRSGNISWESLQSKM